jgi:hypothetical protein
MDSYIVSNGSCFIVTWFVFKNHLLKVGLTQNLRHRWVFKGHFTHEIEST